jgi:hypothetical protein
MDGLNWPASIKSIWREYLLGLLLLTGNMVPGTDLEGIEATTTLCLSLPRYSLSTPPPLSRARNILQLRPRKRGKAAAAARAEKSVAIVWGARPPQVRAYLLMGDDGDRRCPSVWLTGWPLQIVDSHWSLELLRTCGGTVVAIRFPCGGVDICCQSTRYVSANGSDWHLSFASRAL